MSSSTATGELRRHARELLRSCTVRDPRHRDYFISLARKYGLTEAEIEAELCHH